MVLNDVKDTFQDVDEQTRKEIVGMYVAGVPVTIIAKTVGKSIRTIYGYKKRAWWKSLTLIYQDKVEQDITPEEITKANTEGAYLRSIGIEHNFDIEDEDE